MNLTTRNNCRRLAPALRALLDGRPISHDDRAALDLLQRHMEYGAIVGPENVAEQLASIAAQCDSATAAKIHRYLIGNVRALL